jgi:acyl CoA:acetate/3-ketoacid CoA transferase beta subunit
MPVPTAASARLLARRAAREVRPGQRVLVDPALPELAAAVVERGGQLVEVPAAFSDGGAEPGPGPVDLAFVAAEAVGPGGRLRPFDAIPAAIPSSSSSSPGSTAAPAPRRNGGPGAARPARVTFPVLRADRLVAVCVQRDERGASRFRPRLDGGPTGPALRAQVLVTELAVYEVRPEGTVLRELAPGVTARDAQAASDLPLLAGPDLGEAPLD